MVISRNASVLQRIRHLRSHGMTADTLTRHRGHAYSYDVIMLGYNYRMDELRAAMGLVQLARLRQWNKRRYEVSNCYRNIGLAYQFKKPGVGGTDAGPIHLTKAGIPTAVLSLPARYIHSPLSMASKKDLVTGIDLLARAVEKILAEPGNYMSS